MGKWLGERWPIMITDDAGRDVRLVDWAKIPKSDLSGRFNKKYAGGHAGHGEDYKLMMTVAGVYGGIVGGTMALSRPVADFLLRRFNFEYKWLLVAALAGVVAWPLMPVVRRIGRGRKREALRSAYLRARHCASCDYDLGQLPASKEDGLVVCPECGGRWRL